MATLFNTAVEAPTEADQRPRYSIIIPTLNESACIIGTLSSLQGMRARGHEIIVVDGGSHDRTLVLARPLVDRVCANHPPGRARQMNTGATLARGEIFIFLHADTCLPEAADRWLTQALQPSDRRWGRFDVRLSGERFMFRVIETLMNLRSRLTGIATGDQAIFVHRRLFQAIGGFPEIELMEDIALSKCLKRLSPPLCLQPRLITSSRRWERHGVWTMIVRMWLLRLAYWLGVPPARLARHYAKR
jgi:rSAM/selenodomain-associated transferase 2